MSQKGYYERLFSTILAVFVASLVGISPHFRREEAMGLIVTLDYHIESYRCLLGCHIVFCIKKGEEKWSEAGLMMYSDTGESNVSSGLTKILNKIGVDETARIALIESALSDYRRFDELPVHGDIITPDDVLESEEECVSHTVH